MSSYKVSALESTALELGAPDTVKSVLQAIKIILTTPKGTVPMYRDFGVNMDFLDLPAPGAEQRAHMEIREAIEEWEPRATVKDITFSRDELQSGKGLKEQGCNGPVTDALKRMEKHLNEAAHRDENI